jgi:hypothetical protein
MPAMMQSLRVLGPALLVFALTWLVVALAARELTRDTRPTELAVQVRDDGGDPLAEVSVTFADRALGTTDAQGALRVSLVEPARSGPIRALCPEAYRSASAQTLQAANARAAHTFVCRPKLRTLAVVVQREQARGFTLRADRQNLGRLDDHGILHAVVRRPPGSTLSLTLEARAGEASDAAVTRRVLVEDRDRVVLFDSLPSR